MDIFSVLLMGKPLWMWCGFSGVVGTLLAFDLGLFHRTGRDIGVRESLAMSAVYIAIALLFAVAVWATLGAAKAGDFLTGYIVEKTLSIDNVFIISLIFSTLAIPPRYQHRVLFWGIFGAIALRGTMIAAGATLVAEFHWILYVFAGFLIVTGLKMLQADDKPLDLATHPAIAFVRRVVAWTPVLHGEKFIVRQSNPASGRLQWVATPLLLALILIEFADLIFAVDSIPAIFAITTDPFIVTTSNIFAILGLRALYFGLAAFIDRFKYLKQALALVLIFIGAKVFVPPILGWDKFPAAVSLGVTVALIASGIAYSVYRTRNGVAQQTIGAPR